MQDTTRLTMDMIENSLNFRNKNYRDHPELFNKIDKSANKPKVLIITTADFPIDPITITQVNPNDLYVYRCMGAMPAIYQEGAQNQQFNLELDYAINHCQISDIKIIMHSGNGFCANVYEQILNAKNHQNQSQKLSLSQEFALECFGELMDFNQGLVDTITEASSDLIAHYNDFLERSILSLAIKRLSNYPMIQANLPDKIQLSAWWFDIANGDLWIGNYGELFMPAEVILSQNNE